MRPIFAIAFGFLLLLAAVWLFYFPGGTPFSPGIAH
jgi:hypothetical protein